MDKKTDVLIIGAGIAGLTAALKTQKKGLSFALIEASPRVGGVIQTKKENGYLLELGPNTIQPNAALSQLVEDLNLSDQLILADTKTPRYIQHNNTLHPLPLSPLQLLTTSLLSIKGRLRLLLEPLISPDSDSTNESVSRFIRRRLGKEVEERIMAPFVSGVWAGNSHQLSAAESFPRLKTMEKEAGSLFKGLFSARKKDKGEATLKGLLSFNDGLEVLPKSMAKKLGDHIHLETQVHQLKPKANSLWSTLTNRGTFESDQVILALPAHQASPLVLEFHKEASQALKEIPYVPVALAFLACDRKKVGHDLNGFGYLVAPQEQSSILGCLWSSSLFPNRAPHGRALFTVFIGGASTPHLTQKKDEEIYCLAEEEIKKQLTILPAMERVYLHRYKHAIPQYTLGHETRMDALTRAEEEFPGLHFKGNYRGGISVGDVISNGA